MKLGSFRRSLMRYFGVAATSVSPENTPDRDARGYELSVTMTPFVGYLPSSPASDPPKAPATSLGGPNVTSWAEWQDKIDNHYARPGWTFCKFGVRGADKDEASDVWGIVRDGFGAYWCRFFVHSYEHGVSGEHALAVAINARTGYAFGIFSRMDEACEAADMALRLSYRRDLDQDPDDPDSREAYGMLTQALCAAGYSQGTTICRPMKGADIVPGAPIPVWMQREASIPAEVKPS